MASLAWRGPSPRVLSGLYFSPPNEGFSSIFFRSTWGLLFANLEAKVSQSLQMGEIFYCFGQGSIYWLGAGPQPPCVQEQMASLLGTRVSGQKWAPRAEAEPSLPGEHSGNPCGELRWGLAEACRWAWRSGSGAGSFPSEPASLPGAAAVVRDGGVVCDGDHFQAPHGQALDGRLGGAENRRMAQCRSDGLVFRQGSGREVGGGGEGGRGERGEVPWL